MKESILSVGIDIGTSTTQLIFSRLTIENLASSFAVPRITIVDKEVIYRSNIYITPLLSAVEIDAAKVRKMIHDEYLLAGIQPADVVTGAIIITGETARKQNANQVLETLSGLAGDFVVATAGPDLESVISGRGAGTDKISEERRLTIANLDIGGGTSNISVFKDGILVGVSCLDIGGRLVKIHDGKISYIFHKIQKLATYHGIDLHVGDIANLDTLCALCDVMAEILLQSVNFIEKEANFSMLLTNDGKAIDTAWQMDGVTFSGGVADFIYQENHGDDVLQFDDIGILLGQSIRKKWKSIMMYPAAETIRATVVGAGTHTTEISGSTIVYDAALLPMKNIPIIKISPEDETTEAGILTSLAMQIPLFMTEDKLEPVAIAFSGVGYQHFSEIQQLASTLIKALQPILANGLPVILVLEHDIAKALGNALRIRLKDANLICIDSIKTANNDYIDIGEAVGNGQVVPVVIKTLIFNT